MREREKRDERAAAAAAAKHTYTHQTLVTVLREDMLREMNTTSGPCTA